MNKRILYCFLLLFISGSSTLFSCSNPISNSTPEVTGNQQDARTTLINYLTALNQADYSEAARYFGGDPEILRGYNPDVDPTDLETLLKRACEFNGFQCMQLKKIVSEAQDDEDSYLFTVEYQTKMNKLFVLGPCCGATEDEMPSVSQFQIRVKFQDQTYFVMDLPPYVP